MRRPRAAAEGRRASRAAEAASGNVTSAETTTLARSTPLRCAPSAADNGPSRAKLPGPWLRPWVVPLGADGNAAPSRRSAGPEIAVHERRLHHESAHEQRDDGRDEDADAHRQRDGGEPSAQRGAVVHREPAGVGIAAIAAACSTPIMRARCAGLRVDAPPLRWRADRARRSGPSPGTG